MTQLTSSNLHIIHFFGYTHKQTGSQTEFLYFCLYLDMKGKLLVMTILWKRQVIIKFIAIKISGIYIFVNKIQFISGTHPLPATVSNFSLSNKWLGPTTNQQEMNDLNKKL